MDTRIERQYTLTMRDDGGATETETIWVPAGTEAKQDAAAERWAAAEAEKWARTGEWGNDGAIVSVGYTLEDEDSKWPERWAEIKIEPDHDALIRAAGGDTDCNHDWTSEGEGGCTENPGTWNIGGTTWVFRSHCRVCGLRKRETHYGYQRNPGQADTIEYLLPDVDDSE